MERKGSMWAVHAMMYFCNKSLLKFTIAVNIRHLQISCTVSKISYEYLCFRLVEASVLNASSLTTNVYKY